MATAVPHKGGQGKFATDKCLEFIEEMGDREGDLIIKSDQEPSMKYLIGDIVSEREKGKTILEESPVRSSGSNGIVERGVQEMEGRIRGIYIQLQEHLGFEVCAKERIIAFNRLHRGSDGKVPYERIKGKAPSILGIEFGEKVLYKLKPLDKTAKLMARWDYGVFVGVRRRSNELAIATIMDPLFSRYREFIAPPPYSYKDSIIPPSHELSCFIQRFQFVKDFFTKFDPQNRWRLAFDPLIRYLPIRSPMQSIERNDPFFCAYLKT
jgi:hypothetical protein